MEKLKVCIQCFSEKTKTVGTFLSGCETGKQYTKTFDNCVNLFDSKEYQNLKHRIKK